jgi:hypothetical protein
MITFLSQQSDCARHARKNENADTVNFTSQIASLICTDTFAKCVKPDATIFKSRCSRTVLCYRLDRVEALPLNFVRFLRLANGSSMIQRSPARRSRDVRETTGKTSGEISRVIPAQLPRNDRAVTTGMPPGVRQDDSQDNLPCAEHGRTAVAPETCETTRNVIAQRPRRGPHDISRAACRILVIGF